MMAVCSGDLFGDDMKDISAATCSPPPSDLFVRWMPSFYGRRRKNFASSHPCPLIHSRLGRCDWHQRWSMARDLILMQLKKINAAKIKVGGSREAFVGAC
jgi:hypothetical protein